VTRFSKLLIIRHHLSIFPHFFSQKDGWISECFTSKNCFGSEFFFNSKNLIIFRKSIGSARSSTLDLTSSKSTNKITDEVVFGLATSMRNHDTPSSFLRHITSFDTLGDGSDLINFKEEGIAHFLIDTFLYSLRVGNKQVITDNLNIFTHHCCHLGVSGKIILIEWIFNRYDWVFVTEFFIKSDGLILGEDSIVLTCLLTEVVCTLLSVIEFRCSNIKSNINFAHVT